MALPTLSGLATSVYGNNASNAVSYGMAGVVPTDLIRESKLIDIANKAIAERSRRGESAITLPTGYFSGQIIASKVQDIITNVSVAGPVASSAYNGANQNINSPNGLGTTVIGRGRFGIPIYGPVAQPEVITYPQAAAPTFGTSFSKGQAIRSADINVLIGAINTAGAVCTCNCNYCTCNCNYCTCNCNYSCTCNCNYSDENLKANVEYM